MAKNTIKVKKYSDVIEEYTATAVAITPGYLLELTSTGAVQAHSTAGGWATPPMFALEDELQGNGISDNYAVSAKIQVWTPYRGDYVYALLADGENVAIGDKLVSAGDGTLKAHTNDSSATIVEEQVVAVATEAVDLSASANTAAGRIIVKIV